MSVSRENRYRQILMLLGQLNTALRMLLLFIFLTAGVFTGQVSK